MNTHFIQLDGETLSTLMNGKFTAAEHRLFLYLCQLDPFGDRYQDLPDVQDVCAEVDISQATFYRAIAKFKDLQLFDFQSKGFHFRNLRGAKTEKKFSNLRKPLSNLRKNSEDCEKQETESIQTGDLSPSHTFSDSSDFKEKKKFSKPSKKELEAYDRWYEHAYSQGWVAGRHGENVTLKVGPLAGCMRHWQEVSKNLDYFLEPTEPLKTGFLRAAVKRGLGFGK